jgi:hypothetical protein
MMTLQQLLTADIATLRQYALVFPAPLSQAISAKWAEHGSTNCVPSPVQLTDGRFMLSADVLSEVGPGGLLHAMWAASDLQAIAQGTTVMPWSDAVALIPEAEPL